MEFSHVNSEAGVPSQAPEVREQGAGCASQHRVNTASARSLQQKFNSSPLSAVQVRQAGSGQPQVPALEGLGTPRMALQDGQGQVGLDSCTNRA